MNLPFAAKMLIVVALLASGSAAMGQVADNSSTDSGAYGSMFGNRPTLGGTLSPGNSTLFGSPRGTSNSQGPGFVGRNNRATSPDGAGTQSGRHFVGAAQAGQKSGPGGQGEPEGLVSGPLAATRRAANANAATGMASGQQSGQAAPRYPVTLRIGFDYRPRGADRLSAQLARRLANASSIHALSPIRVEVQGRTAVLRGRVRSEQDRALAEQLARLEPGIGEVQNEIVVAGSGPE